MTTKVTVDAHAGWPVQVELIDQYPSQTEPTISVEIVAPHTVREFFIHSNRVLKATELKKEE